MRDQNDAKLANPHPAVITSCNQNPTSEKKAKWPDELAATISPDKNNGTRRRIMDKIMCCSKDGDCLLID